MISLVRFGIFVVLFSTAVFSMEKTENPPYAMGPLLRFLGQNGQNWQVSVLYVVKTNYLNRYQQPFVYHDNNVIHDVKPQIIATKFGYDFIKFNLQIHQGVEEKKIYYWLVHEMDEHYFTVPAQKTSPTILYHSCNGYQRDADRQAMNGIQPMWREIIRRHHKKAFHFQLAGGDQLYADGIIDEKTGHRHAPKLGEIYGVFSLDTLQEWLLLKKDHNALNRMQFSQEMENEVEKFYFNHYIKHYNEPHFKEAMASIPSLSQPDDHDFFDGCGSYPDFLQNSLVMSGIRRIATWYCFTIQHHMQQENFPKYDGSLVMGHNFLHTINGKLSILGVDTRSERTRTQVVSKYTWKQIFHVLAQIPETSEHLIVMLGIPIVFASAKKLEKPLTYSETHHSAERLLGCVLAKNIFGLFELEDDVHDGWGHKDHKDERNWLIKKLQHFAEKKKIRVTFFGGDVHVAGAGKIYDADNTIDDCSPNVIYQIISSPVGNVSASKTFAHLLGTIATHAKKVPPSCQMNMIKLPRKDSCKEKVIINRRNFAVVNLGPTGTLDVEWSAEPHPNKKNYQQPHRIYYLSIPCVEKNM